MEEKDVKVVCKLLQTYLQKFDLAPIYSEEEVRHWFLHKGDDLTRVIWAYVVEVPSLNLHHTYGIGSIQQRDH